MVCTFFGHRDCFSLDESVLERTISDLIGKGVDTFYVGNQGNFDAMVHSCLKRLQKSYPHIRYGVVLAYMPKEAAPDTMLPEGMELVHPQYAIDRRNRWMLKQSEYVVTYIRWTWGGAYKYATLAERAGKRVIAL